MSKKLIILFIFTFLLSTTGLPISLHYCQMQGSMSLSDCEMCLTGESQEETSCCEKEDNYPIQLKNDTNDNCCELKVIDSSVKENFLPNKNELRIDKTLFTLSLSATDLLQTSDYNKSNQNFCESSPPIQKNDIYLKISSLLI